MVQSRGKATTLLVDGTRYWLQLWALFAFFHCIVHGSPLRKPEDTAINASSHRPNKRSTTSRQVSLRDQMVIATFVCDKPGGILVSLFKTLLYSAVRHKSSSKKITFMVVYDPLFSPQPDVLLCDDTTNALAGPMTTITHEFKSYLLSFNVVVEFYPTVNNSFVDRYGRCASSKLWIHDILPDVELAMVVDVDTLFLENPFHLWDMFFNTTAFNETIIYAAASEGNLPPYGNYVQNKDIWGPLGDMRAGPYGVNRWGGLALSTPC